MTLSNFQKHLTAISKTAQKGRPMLSNWLLSSDYWYVTDRFRAIRVPNTIPVKNDVIVNPDTMQENIEAKENGGRYPSMSGLFLETTDETPRIEVNPSKLALRMLNALKSEDKVALLAEGRKLKITDTKQTSVATTFELTTELKLKEPVYVSPKYLIDLINALTDCQDKTFALTMLSPTRPIQFENSELTYLITPIRKFK